MTGQNYECFEEQVNKGGKIFCLYDIWGTTVSNGMLIVMICDRYY